jgi:two-component system, cell cycle response regulator DivK
MDLTRVLVVDDHAIFIEMATFVLRAAAFEVRSAGDANEALGVIPAFRPHVILMDIQMPVMDGIELTRQLKADAATKEIVILAFTAFAAKGDARILQSAGFNGYIGKPVDVMTLAAEVRFWLEGPPSARASHFAWP